MPTFHCDLAWLGDDGVASDVVIAVDGDRIVEIAPSRRRPAGATVLAGLTLPGFVNSHSHAFHRVLRGRTQGGRGTFWSWRDRMYEVAARLTPDSYRALARAVYGEMVLAGFTLVGEFHYLHHGTGGEPYPDPNAMGGALVDAAADAGLRLTLLDTCYLRGGIGVALDEVQRRFSDGDALSWATRASTLADGLASHATTRVGAAVHSVRAVDPPAMKVVAAWASSRGAPLHAHVSEQPAENAQCFAAYGGTPVKLLDRHGLLGERFTAVHATHLTEADIATLGASRSWCCFCPTTERELADGIGPSRDLVDAGARLTLGSDAHAVIDPFEEARALELHQRLNTGIRGSHAPVDLLTMATAHGAASLGWPDAGRLDVGALADFVTIGEATVRTAGLRSDPLGIATFAATATDVRHVVVGGELVVEDGRHRSIDVVAELAEVLS